MMDTASYDGLDTPSSSDADEHKDNPAVYAEGELFPQVTSDESYGRWLDLEM